MMSTRNVTNIVHMLLCVDYYSVLSNTRFYIWYLQKTNIKFPVA